MSCMLLSAEFRLLPVGKQLLFPLHVSLYSVGFPVLPKVLITAKIKRMIVMTDYKMPKATSHFSLHTCVRNLHLQNCIWQSSSQRHRTCYTYLTGSARIMICKLNGSLSCGSCRSGWAHLFWESEQLPYILPLVCEVPLAGPPSF